MPTTTNREPASRDRGSVEQRLARLLDAPFLAQVAPHLTPETLHQLIQRQGLEACGALVTSATPAQLTLLLDLDLWRHPQPGRDEQFDVDRFGEWLEVLADTGDSAAARTVAALDTDLVIAGLSRYLRVFDPGTFEPAESSDDESKHRDERMNSETSDHALECELGGYLIRARRPDAWDAIVTLLVALETEHNVYFHAVMKGCRPLSNSRPEIDGLDDLLTAGEQHLHDVAIARDRRQSRQGYTTPADARAFLQMARQPHPTPRSSRPLARGSMRAESTAPPPATINPIAAAYFRAADEDAAPTPAGTVADGRVSAAHGDATAAAARGEDGTPPSIEAVIELLVEAGVIPQAHPALLGAADEDGAGRLPLLRPLMEFLLRHDGSAYLERTRELAFLANTLLAGLSVQTRALTPREAADAAACICNLGLEHWPERWPGATSLGTPSAGTHDVRRPPDDFLAAHHLVLAFEVGWSVLYTDVSVFVADQLIATLSGLDCADAGLRRELAVLRRALVKLRGAGTPWLARDAADALAMLDMTAWAGVLGLLDECPILPAALTAVVERRTTAVSATAFEFISTAAQLGDVRLFMRMLPAVLSR